jgi:glyoxylase-like metal-dependent hydrolase (beta-lactamase superfamily II)
MSEVHAPICTACGTQFPPANQPPSSCPICTDDRQFLPPSGQGWTTLDAICKKHFNSFRQLEPGLIGIGTVPQFAIGQRALLLRTPAGNILWECVSLLDNATIEIINGLGGLAGIAVSHPHYYSTMVDWSRAFGDVPIYLHAADRRWVMRNDEAVQFWDGDTLPIMNGVTLIRCGGHFAGGTVLHWQEGGNGRGAIMSGDVVMVLPDRNYVSFMRSYPNLLPLAAPTVERIETTLQPFEFQMIYGAFFDRDIRDNGKDIVTRSVRRYVSAIRGDGTADLL